MEEATNEIFFLGSCYKEMIFLDEDCHKEIKQRVRQPFQLAMGELEI